METIYLRKSSLLLEKVKEKRGLYVCKKCHETDRKAIKCAIPFESHTFSLRRSKCDICGEIEKIVYCPKYPIVLIPPEKQAPPEKQG